MFELGVDEAEGPLTAEYCLGYCSSAVRIAVRACFQNLVARRRGEEQEAHYFAGCGAEGDDRPAAGSSGSTDSVAGAVAQMAASAAAAVAAPGWSVQSLWAPFWLGACLLPS